MSDPVRTRPRRLLLLSFGLLLLAPWLAVYAPPLPGPRAVRRGVEDPSRIFWDERPVPARRGTILDREGRPLAFSLPAYHILVNARELEEADRVWVAQRLAQAFDLDLEWALRQVNASWERGGPVRLAYFVRPEDLQPGEEPSEKGMEEILRELERELLQSRKLLLSGFLLEAEPVFQRVYRTRPGAVDLVGVLNMDGVPQSGIEAQYQDLLAGRDGWQEGWFSLDGRLLPWLGAKVNERPRDGQDLLLALDLTVQERAEAALEAAVERFDALEGEILVLDPRSGEILAYARRPTFDPNGLLSWTARDRDRIYFTPLQMGAYEPGSTLKVATVAAALEAGIITPQGRYEDRGILQVCPGAPPIRNWDGRALGSATYTELLIRSSNYGAATLALRLGPEGLIPVLERLGLGQPTGVDLPGEAAGQIRRDLRPEASCADRHLLAVMSFGQGLTATPIQVAALFAAVANGGLWIQPHVALQSREPWEETFHPLDRPLVRRQALRRETAHNLAQMLAAVGDAEVWIQSDGSYGPYLPGYRVALKTGTAQIPCPTCEDGYDPDRVNASVVIFAPADDPRFVLYLRLKVVDNWGSTTAAPAARPLAAWLLREYFRIPPSSP